MEKSRLRNTFFDAHLHSCRICVKNREAKKEVRPLNDRKANQSEALLSAAPLPTLLIFAVPIILGNVFQQLYNIVDAMVVGKFLGDLPLSGISVASPVMDILYALILGGSIGVGVLVGQLCGAGDWERLKRVHATALLGGCGITVLLAVLGFAFTERILIAQGTEAAAVAQAMSYLYIILGGLIFCFLYNYYAAVLRSYGNSRTPFVVLLTSSTLHAVLDVLLCGAAHLGIYGVACSTVFCQIFSTVWLMLYVEKKVPPLHLERGDLRLDPKLGKMILSYAWAAALQQAVVMIGRFLVQGMLTPLGGTSVTGYNMSLRVEQFLFCFSQGISAAMVWACPRTSATAAARGCGNSTSPASAWRWCCWRCWVRRCISSRRRSSACFPTTPMWLPRVCAIPARWRISIFLRSSVR